MEAYEEYEHKGLTISIYPDTDAIDPREDWDHATTMVTAHRLYKLGDVQLSRDDDPAEWLHDNPQRIIKSLYLYDHSGLSISMSSFHDPWDSGQVGIICMSDAQIRENYGVKRITKQVLEQAEKLMAEEVEEYDMYLRGDVYGYVVTDDAGNEVDACWGFYGLDSCKESAEDAADFESARRTKFENENTVACDI